jgi:oxygen-dependent protoporphyrinogen oxidase
MSGNKKVIILGSGLTGMVLAHKLNQKGIEVQVLEKAPRPGGVIHTESSNGFLYEKGPNTGIVKYGEVSELFEELAGSCQIEIPDDSVKKRYIWKGDRWHQLPSGLMGGIKTPLFSWKDKFRILGEPFRKPGQNPEETLDHMVRRRMGESFLNYAVDPFILGVYAGDPARIVPKYALPKLYNLEQEYGSFIRGAIKKKSEEKSEMEKKATKDVFSVKGGLFNLIEALVQSVGKEKIELNLGDITVQPSENSFEVSYKAHGKLKKTNAQYVVSTIGSYEIPNVFSFIDNSLLDKINNLKYAKVLQAAIGFNQWHGIPLEGFGGLVPNVENRDILGALFMSSFLEDRAPDEGALLSVFLGGIRREELYYEEDKKIEEILSKEVSSMFGLKEFNPDLLKIMRYEYAIPQYGNESKERFGAVKEAENKYPGLKIIGNLKDGIGMADRIKQAWDLAEELEK